MNVEKPTATQITLRRLLETCEDSQKAFRTAATAVEDAPLKADFSSWAKEREQFCTQLTNLLTILNTDPMFYQFEEGSVAGFLQRAWMNLTSALSSGDEMAIVKACETGESWSRESYQTAVESNLPDKVREVVEDQMGAVVRVQNALRRFREEAESSNG